MRDQLLYTPEGVSNQQFVDTFAKLEKKKLTYKERLTPHGKRIVDMVMKQKKIVDFVKMWRQHFLDTMQPKEMPYCWQDCPEVYASFGLSKPNADEIAKIAKQKPIQTAPDQPLF